MAWAGREPHLSLIGPPYSRSWGITLSYGRRKVLRALIILSLLFLLLHTAQQRIWPSRRQTRHPRPLAQSDPCRQMEKAADRFACQAEYSYSAYTRWLGSQSNTITEAKEEYSKRYERPAPEWLANWFHLCRKWRIPVIDDYDQVELDVRPFRLVPDKRKLISTMESVYENIQLEGGWTQMSKMTVEAGKLGVDFPWPQYEGILKGFMYVIGPIAHLLPDLSILVNWSDLPQVRAAAFEQPPSAKLERTLQPDDGRLDIALKMCPVEGGVVRNAHVDRLLYKPRKDVCTSSEQKDLARMHGRYQHRVWQYTTQLPVLSTAKMAFDQDLLYPMRGDQYGLFEYADPIPFTRKRPSLFWRGSNSGQQNSMSNWNITHRARWALAAQRWNATQAELHTRKRSYTETLALDDRLTEGVVGALDNLPTNFFNVSLTGYGFCEGGEDTVSSCRTLERASPKGTFVPRGESLEHRFIMDLDGYGMSERFMGYLTTNSVILKQSEWAEWHTERVIPWVHFVPVSLELDEVPEMMDFLVNDKRGRAVAKRIARESTRWTKTGLSVQAQAAYMLRLLSEYADAVR